MSKETDIEGGMPMVKVLAIGSLGMSSSCSGNNGGKGLGGNCGIFIFIALLLSWETHHGQPKRSSEEIYSKLNYLPGNSPLIAVNVDSAICTASSHFLRLGRYVHLCPKQHTTCFNQADQFG
jgi:hypothetical protein